MYQMTPESLAQIVHFRHLATETELLTARDTIRGMVKCADQAGLSTDARERLDSMLSHVSCELRLRERLASMVARG